MQHCASIRKCISWDKSPFSLTRHTGNYQTQTHVQLEGKGNNFYMLSLPWLKWVDLILGDRNQNAKWPLQVVGWWKWQTDEGCLLPHLHLSGCLLPPWAHCPPGCFTLHSNSWSLRASERRMRASSSSTSSSNLTQNNIAPSALPACFAQSLCLKKWLARIRQN